MKMIINAEGVRKLIEHDPEGTVEITKNASAQVAAYLADQITEDRVSNRVRTLLGNQIVREDLVAYGRTLIADAVKKSVEARLDEATVLQIVAMHREGQKEFIAHIEKQVMAGMVEKIDALLRERFAAMFNKVS